MPTLARLQPSSPCRRPTRSAALLLALLAACGGGSSAPPQPPPPTVAGVAPSSGPAAGGTAVTISGAGFQAGATVTIGGVSAAVGPVTATSISATTPAHAAGPVDVTVTNPDGQVSTLAAGFTYQAPPPPGPTLTGVTPTHGNLGTVVTITSPDLGTDPAAVQVTFRAPAQGAMTVAPLALVAGTLTVVVPSAVAEQAAITVTVAGGTSAPVPFTIDALADGAPVGAAQAFFADVDAVLARLLPEVDAGIVPLLEQAGQGLDAARVRDGLTRLRALYAQAAVNTLGAANADRRAAFDAFLGSSAGAAVRAELQALAAALPPVPAGAKAPGAATPTRAAFDSGLLGGFDSGTVENIEAAKAFLNRAYNILDRLNDALLTAIVACGAASAVFPGAASLIPTLEMVREEIVKPLLEILKTIIPLMETIPTRIAGDTLRIEVVEHNLWLDQTFGSMTAPIPFDNVGAVLVTEPYGVKGFLTFKNDGGASLRATGQDLLPTLAPLAEAIAELGGFNIGALEVTDCETRLRLATAGPDLFRGDWAEPLLWVNALRPGLGVVQLIADMDQVKPVCERDLFGVIIGTCIEEQDVTVSRTLRAIAGTQLAGPYTQGPRLDAIQVAGQPPATGYLGDTALFTGEGFSSNPQLAHQDIQFTPAPGFDGTGLAWSIHQQRYGFASFEVEVIDALPGPVSVVIDGSPSNALDFTVLDPLLEAVPPSAIVGEYQVFGGRGFSHVPGHNAGDWAGFQAPAEGGSHTMLEFTIPDGAQSGPFRVVTLGQLVSNTQEVTVRRWSEPALLSGGGRLGLRPAVAFDRQTGRRLVAWVERNDVLEHGAARLVASLNAPGASVAGTPVVLPAQLGGHPAVPPRPAVAAANGWLYVAWVERVPGVDLKDRVVLSRSQDGLTWSAPLTLSNGQAQARQPALGADGDLVVAAWIDEGAEGQVGAIRLSRSIDAGAHFAPYANAAPAGDTSDPAVAVKANAVAVAWSRVDGAGRAVSVTRSEDFGANFAQVVKFPAPAGTVGFGRHPSVALGPSCVVDSLASVYLAWEQSSAAELAEEVMFARVDAVNGGTVVQNVSNSAVHSQSPQLVVDDDCIPAIAWLELGHSKAQLMDASQGLPLGPAPATLLFARSFDGGATFNERRTPLARNTQGDRLGHLSMAGGGRALLTVVHQDDFGGSAVAVRTTDGEGFGPAAQPPAPEGELSADLVYHHSEGALWVSSPDGRWPQRITRTHAAGTAAAVRPDGRYVAWLPSADRTFVAEADGAHPLQITSTADFAWAGAMSWSGSAGFLSVASPTVPQRSGWVRPDGSGFAISGTNMALGAMGHPGLQPWSPGGLLALGGSGSLMTYEPNTGVASDLSPVDPAGFPGDPAYPAWSPDGSRLAIIVAATSAAWTVDGLGTGDLYVYDVVLGTLHRLTDDGKATTPAWSPDGTRIAFVRNAFSPRQLVVMRADAAPRDETVLTNPFLEDDTEPAWHPDGRAVLVARRILTEVFPVLTSVNPGNGNAFALSGTWSAGAAPVHLGNRPTWATDAAASSGAAGSSSVDLSWTPAADDAGVHHYQIWSGTTLVQDQVSGTGTTLTGLTPETSYTFTVLACDAAGNCTLTGPQVAVTTGAPQAPPTWSVVPPALGHGPAWSPGDPLYDDPYAVTVHWTAATEPGVEYRFFVQGEVTPRWVSATGNTDAFSLDGLRPLTTYDFTVQACHQGTEICTSDGPSLTVTTREDTSPPDLYSVRVAADVVTLDFSDPMDPASTPAPGDFTFEVSGGGGAAAPRTIQQVVVAGVPGSPGRTQVVLKLAEPVVLGEVAWLSYASGAAPLRNLGGLPAQDFLLRPAQNGADLGFAALAGAPFDDVVVAGWFSGAVRFGATTLTSWGERDAFVARRSAAGQWLWARRLCGDGFDEATSVAVDAAGGVYLGGAFSGQVLVGTVIQGPTFLLVAEGASDAFVAKLDAAGQWAWLTRLGGEGLGPQDDAHNGFAPEATLALAVDPTGGVVAGGRFLFTASAGTTTPRLTSAGNSDAWVAKLAANGTFAWVTRAGDVTSDDYAITEIATDGTSTFVAGSFMGALSFEGAAAPIVADGNSQLYLARLGAGGALDWARTVNGSWPGGTAGALETDGEGGVYLGGRVGVGASGFSVTYAPHVSRWSAAGALAWAVQGNASGGVVGLARQSDGSLLLGGPFEGTLGFSGQTVSGSPNGDTFAARLAASDGSGQGAWTSGNGTNSSIPTPLAAAGCGEGRLCLALSVFGYAPDAAVQFGPLTRGIGQSTQPLVVRLGSDVAFPSVGTWLQLFGTEDTP